MYISPAALSPLESAVHAYAATSGRPAMGVLLAVRSHTLRFDGAKIVDPAAMRLASARALFAPDVPSGSAHDAQMLMRMGQAVLDGTLTTCFHCGQMFTDRALGFDHFGESESEVVRCLKSI